MKKIILLSDTHSALDERFLPHLEDANEIWHAGDIGDIKVLENLEKTTKVRAVYGNIDNHIIRSATKEFINFKCEEVNVLITHIGGYPGKYSKGIKEKIQKLRPKLFICGHSHILKVIFDKRFNLLHMNPGAAGNYGIHKVKTILKFKIDKENITDLKVIELER
ncbi:metallophosphoesterase family protein [Flavobacteriales bacterium]|jgi:putative phosphoesterase|nr:metallophosphoesterase family protein [Flavobacteriales bacterium]